MDKKTYEVAEGVAWVNGAPTPKSRKVELTDIEARFDLEQGRIYPEGRAPKPQPKADAATKADDAK